ncbi:MAG: threonine synthase, partial [Candidatus Paceibacteria bacterium]
MAEARTKLVCQGCGHEPAPEEPMPFQCSARREGDDCDHLLALQTTQPPPTLDLGDDDNPFVAFRSRAFSHGRWMASGKSDAAYVALVREIGSAIERVAGTNFHTTPWCKSTKLGVRFKDETGNVGGSHKARHLFGIALAIEVAERTGRLHTASLGTPERPLAIASCGNAALAAAMVAKAWGRTLQVFIPDWADPVVV